MGMFEGTKWDRPSHCERCDLPETECRCPPEPVKTERTPPEKQTLKLSTEKRRKGKLVTVVRGLAADNDLPALLTKLKSGLGTGGTLAAGELEIQGDQVARARALLKSWGYRVQ